MAQTKLDSDQVNVTGGGVTYWTEAYNSGTQATSSFLATGVGTNINAAILPKGTGAILAEIPDGATSGGNSRGQYAVDFQMNRTSADQVATGDRSFIGGGQNNKIGAANSAITAGSTNFINSVGSFIGAGTNNTCNGGSAFIISGDSQTVSNGNCGIGGGYGNNAAGQYNFIFGGYFNRTEASHSSILGGREARTTIYGEQSHASGQFGNLGSAQYSRVVLRRSITGTAITELFADGSTQRAILETSGTYGNYIIWSARVQVVASVKTVGNGTCSVGDSWVSEHAVGIKNVNGTTSLIGTVQNLYTAQADTNMSSAAVTITADNTNDALKVEFTPPSTAGSTTVIQVVATISLTQTRY